GNAPMRKAGRQDAPVETTKRRMVEDVQELRLEVEAESLGDPEVLGNRRVIERLVGSVQIEDLSDGPRRGVYVDVGRIRRSAGRGSEVLRIDQVDIAAASGAYVVHADGVLQSGGRDAIEHHSAIGVIVEGAVAAACQADGRAGLERENVSD